MKIVIVGTVTGILAAHFGGWEALLWVFIGFVNGAVVFEGSELWREVKAGLRR